MFRWVTIYIVLIIFLTQSMCVIPEDINTQEKVENSAPLIQYSSPTTHVINIILADTDPERELEFTVEAFDPDGDAVSYKWETIVCEGNACSYNVYPEDTNTYKYTAGLPQKDVFVGLEVSDGLYNVYHYWVIRIQKKVI